MIGRSRRLSCEENGIGLSLGELTSLVGVIKTAPWDKNSIYRPKAKQDRHRLEPKRRGGNIKLLN